MIALSTIAKITPVDRIKSKGGYATIRRVRINRVLEIQLWWEFVAKRSNQSRSSQDGAPERINGGEDCICRCHMLLCDPR
jgi:hypothetical protein